MGLLPALVQAGAALEARDALGQTALHCAVAASQCRAVQFLLERAVMVDAPDSQGCAPVHLAADLPDPGALQLLITGGCDLTQCDGNGHPPLMRATIRGNEAASRTLLAAHADPNQVVHLLFKRRACNLGTPLPLFSFFFY